MKQLNIGIVGLGRLGKEYATNLLFKIRNAHVLAACSIIEEERAYARDELAISNVFESYEEMLETPNLEAVFVISSTDMHAQHIIEALRAGKHVFSEKPLAISLDACKQVEEVAKQHPNLKAVVGFVRRYDASYQYAKRKIKSGAIGKPFMVRSQTVDQDVVNDFQLQYVGKSGGIFHDYNVHDIDLARWFLMSEIESVYALGGSFKHKGFEDAGDADNVVTTCQMTNGTMAIIHASRTAMHGHDTYTEVTGTLGTLRIGRPAGKNRVEIYDIHGVRKECVTTFWERFEDAFLTMAQDFVNCVLEDLPPELSIRDAIMATEAAIAFTKSFREQELVRIIR